MHDFTEQQSLYTHSHTRWAGPSNGNWSPELHNGAVQHLPINFLNKEQFFCVFKKERWLSIDYWLPMKQLSRYWKAKRFSNACNNCTQGVDTLQLKSSSWRRRQLYHSNDPRRTHVSILLLLPTVNKGCFTSARWSQTQARTKWQWHLSVGLPEKKKRSCGWSIHSHTKAALS